jgi:chorismate mutase
VVIRAIRGATQVDVDEKEHVLEVTRAMLRELLEENKLEPDDVISVVFSATKDLSSVAPAVAARQLGFNDTALLCLQEMHVEGSMPRCVRLIAHVETDLPRDAVHNVYQRGTESLRRDVPPIPEHPVRIARPPAAESFVPYGD